MIARQLVDKIHIHIGIFQLLMQILFNNVGCWRYLAVIFDDKLYFDTVLICIRIFPFLFLILHLKFSQTKNTISRYLKTSPTGLIQIHRCSLALILLMKKLNTDSLSLALKPASPAGPRQARMTFSRSSLSNRLGTSPIIYMNTHNTM